MPSNNFILCCPFLLLPSIFPSIIVFSNGSALCIRWPKYWSFSYSISSVSCSGMSDSLRPHGLKHTRAPCPSPTPEVYSNLCPSSRWCHLTISSSVVPFSSCPQSFPVWGFFQISQFFESGGQSFGVSTSAAVLPINIHDWFSLGLTGLISLQFEGPSKVFSAAAIQCCWMNEQEEKKRKTKSNSFLPR